MFGKGQKKGITRFALQAGKQAREVAVAGDFNHWKPVPMKNQGKGLFVCQVRTSDKTFEYKFVVDGTWLTDPDNPRFSPNPFGTFNSVAPHDSQVALKL